jgi:hypothetical protein
MLKQWMMETSARERRRLFREGMQEWTGREVSDAEVKDLMQALNNQIWNRDEDEV